MPSDGETWALLAEALEPVAPPPSVRARLLAAIDGPLRYRPFAKDLSRLFDLSLEDTHALLERLDRRNAWTPGVPPVHGFLHFRPGNAVAPLRAGLVRLQAESGFPV